jgi:phosphoglycerol transferase
MLPATPPAWRRETAIVLLLCLALTAGWLTAIGRWRPSSWQTALTYQGDALYYLALAKASAENGAVPYAWKHVARLNAPSGADWNDFPIGNEPLWSLLGISMKLFGVAGTTLWPVLLAHLLAALAFYLAARWRGSEVWTAATLALLFGLAPYLLKRSFMHLNLTFAWHLPLALLVALWVAEGDELVDRRRWLAALATAVFCGVQAIYYAMFFLLLLGGGLAVRRLSGIRGGWRRPAWLAGITLLLAFAGNLDTLTWAWGHGKNALITSRTVAEVDFYALRPVELFLPKGEAAGRGRELFERLYYREQIAGEPGTAYLGVVGAASLLVLLGWTFAAVAAPGRFRPPAEGWVVALSFAFAIAGGGGMALAITGWRYFRAGNRLSILILAIALLFLARWLSAWRWRARAWTLAVLLVAGVWDAMPRRDQARDARWAELYQGDVELAARLETARSEGLLPSGRIFQLPLAEFPEGPPVDRLDPYELLRLYVHSWSLEFSFGAHRGRGDDAWQREVAALPWPEAFNRLRERGFDAIAVYGYGYEDRGQALVAALKAAGGVPLAAHPTQTIQVILLPPAPR